MSSFADHFSGHARDYSRHRPSYPASMIEELVALAPSRDLAWDCATGNGQAAVLLAEHVAHVIATDASPQQLAQARPHPRVEYRVARAEDSGLSSSSVDLITVAAAAHWFDHARFHAEVDRVLVPGGVLAVWTYDPVHVSPDVDRVLRWFQRERVVRYWPPQRAYVDALYTTLPFPYADLQLGPFEIEATIDRDDWLGYVSTWSATARCREAEGIDPLIELERAVAPLWPDAKERRRGVWPLAHRVGRKPAAHGRAH